MMYECVLTFLGLYAKGYGSRRTGRNSPVLNIALSP